MAGSVGHWIYDALRRRQAPAALALVAFLGSLAIRFPVDLLLAPMAFVRPRAWLTLAGLATLGSVMGGTLLFLLGGASSQLFVTLSQMLLDGLNLQNAFDVFIREHATEGTMAIIFASIALVPYRAIALAAGVVEVPFWQFLAMSVLVRGVRYGTVAFVSALAGGALLGDRDGAR